METICNKDWPDYKQEKTKPTGLDTDIESTLRQLVTTKLTKLWHRLYYAYWYIVLQSLNKVQESFGSCPVILLKE